MKETHEFLVPDYYPGFHCKMGACRAACCDGWPVTLSLEDYFRLLNADCSDALRRKISDSLHPLPAPTPDEYARIDHDYNGVCRLRLPDGRCALHAEAGEDALAPLCRLFPRGVRSQGIYECSCALSCEATLELLYGREAPLAFVPRTLTIDVPRGARGVRFETYGHEQALRLGFIGMMQNRRRTLPERLSRLSDAIAVTETALRRNDQAAIEALLRRATHEGNDAETAHPAPAAPDDGAIDVAERLVALTARHSDALRDYGEAAVRYFDRERAAERYAAARARFEAAYPLWEPFFEHVLVNHMFFSRFPFQDRPDSITHEKLSLDAIYILLRFIALGYAAQIGTKEALIDAFHAAFRLIDHTAFDSIAGEELSEMTGGDRERVDALLRL